MRKAGALCAAHAEMTDEVAAHCNKARGFEELAEWDQDEAIGPSIFT